METSQVANHIERILERHQVDRIWLAGSRANGTAFNDLEAENKRLKEYGLRPKLRVSDWDYVTEPPVIDRFDEIDIIGHAGRKRILVYDRGRILFSMINRLNESTDGNK